MSLTPGHPLGASKAHSREAKLSFDMLMGNVGRLEACHELGELSISQGSRVYGPSS